MSLRPTRKLTGIRSLCGGCGEYFNGVSVFEMHRAGPFAPINRPDTRRCLRVDQMIAKGWGLTSDGFWTTGKRPAIREGGAIPGAPADPLPNAGAETISRGNALPVGAADA